MNLKRVTAALAAIMLSVGIVGSIGTNAYSSKGSWRTQYNSGAPSNTSATYAGYVSMYTYGGGYCSYCSSLSGGNDRYVTVTASGMVSYRITSTGYSSKKAISTSSNQITMKFMAHSATTPTGVGSAGYYS